MTELEHVKLLIGDLVLTLAKLQADNEMLRVNQKPAPKPTKGTA